MKSLTSKALVSYKSSYLWLHRWFYQNTHTNTHAYPYSHNRIRDWNELACIFNRWWTFLHSLNINFKAKIMQTLANGFCIIFFTLQRDTKHWINTYRDTQCTQCNSIILFNKMYDARCSNILAHSYAMHIMFTKSYPKMKWEKKKKDLVCRNIKITNVCIIINLQFCGHCRPVYLFLK